MKKIHSLVRCAGVTLQVIVLGELLFLAIIAIYSLHVGARIFRYAQF